MSETVKGIIGWLIIFTFIGMYASVIYFSCRRDALKADGAASISNRAVSQVNLISRRAFNSYNFKDQGKTSEVDAWGQEITWFIVRDGDGYFLEVRSNGPDGIPFTKDDIIALACISDTKAADGLLRCGSK